MRVGPQLRRHQLRQLRAGAGLRLHRRPPDGDAVTDGNPRQRTSSPIGRAGTLPPWRRSRRSLRSRGWRRSGAPGGRPTAPTASTAPRPRDEVFSIDTPPPTVSGAAAHRPRDVVHAHRPRRPLPAHARQGGLLPDGVGRQRPQRRAPRPAPHRHGRRPHPPLRPLRPAAGEGRSQGAPHPREPPELRRAVRGGRPAARGAVPRALVDRRAVGGLGAHLHLHRHQGHAHLAARVPPPRPPRPGLPQRVADPVGRRHAHRGGPGRARGPRAPRRLPQARVRRPRRPAPRRHHPAGAPARLRGRRRPSRRRAVPASVRAARHHPAVRRVRADRRPRAGRPREGHRRGDDLHVRRHDRRHVVARALAAGPHRRPARRPPPTRHVG